jgi:hypothetical protein
VLHYPKAPERKETMRRKRGQYQILTATPRKSQNAAEHIERVKMMMEKAYQRRKTYGKGTEEKHCQSLQRG